MNRHRLDELHRWHIRDVAFNVGKSVVEGVSHSGVKRIGGLWIVPAVSRCLAHTDPENTVFGILDRSQGRGGRLVSDDHVTPPRASVLDDPDVQRLYPGWSEEQVLADLARQIREDDSRPEVQQELADFRALFVGD